MNLTATGPVICRAKDRQERQKINREEEGKWKTEMRQRYGKRETERERDLIKERQRQRYISSV